MIFKCKIAKNQINLFRSLKYILVQGIDVEIESSQNEEGFKILHIKETKEESFVFSFRTHRYGDRKNNIKCPGEMKEKHNMGNELFQRKQSSQNKYFRLKMVKYSIGRNCNEQQISTIFLKCTCTNMKVLEWLFVQIQSTA